MVIAFQIVLFIIIGIFSLGAVSEKSKEPLQVYGSIVIAAIIAMLLSFWIL